MIASSLPLRFHYGALESPEERRRGKPRAAGGAWEALRSDRCATVRSFTVIVSFTGPLLLPEKLTREAARKADKPERLIPRPKGQPGRSSGYNLQEAMGLEEDSTHFCRLHVSRDLNLIVVF